MAVKESKIHGAVTAAPAHAIVALMLTLLERVWSASDKANILKAVCAYHGYAITKVP